MTKRKALASTIVKLLLVMLGLIRVTGRYLQEVRESVLDMSRLLWPHLGRNASRIEAICLDLIMCLLLSNTTPDVGYDKQCARSSDYIEGKPRPMMSVEATPEAAAASVQ
jgi:hypothetical protein